jgi:hypothetical protein
MIVYPFSFLKSNREITHTIIGSDLFSSINTGYSYDPTTWSSGNTSSSFIGSVRAISSNGNMWVIGGISGSKTCGYSYDGINWSAMTNSTLLGGNCDDFYWDGTKWFAVGNTNPLSSEALATSTDGITWSPNTGFTSIGGISCITGNGSKYVAGGTSNPFIAYSNDGITWSGATSGLTNMLQIWSIATNGSIFVAGAESTTSGKQILYSYDGDTWSNTNAGTIFGNGVGARVRGIAWNGSFFLAVGQGAFGNPYDAAKSTDGITWTGITAPYTNNYSISWDGNNFYVAGSSSTSVAYSPDGDSWSYGTFVSPTTNRFAISTFQQPNKIPPII